jgi:hypothetical protein
MKMKLAGENPILFRCACPGCQKKEELAVKRDRKGRLYGVCMVCQGRIFGTNLLAKYVDKAGGLYSIKLEQMKLAEFDELIDTFARA